MRVAPGPKTASAEAAESPAARRSAASSWRDPRLVIGIVIVAISVLAGARLFSSADDVVSVWAPRVDLGRGASLSPDALSRREVRFSTAADANRYVSADAAIPADATLLRAVGSGELLPRAALGAGESSPVTEVPLSVPVDAVPQTVEVGSVVDVWVTPEAAAAGGRAEESLLIFEDVLVIAAPSPGSTLAPSGTRQIIIGVPQTKEDQLAGALAKAAQGTTVVTRRG